MSSFPTVSDFESLLVNNPQVQAIDAYLQRFNPIKIMKMESMEIRHSSILRWLLDPFGNHGMGDRFLKAFLAEALRGQKQQGGLTALDILAEDFSTAHVVAEWRHIDLFIQLSRADIDWVFIVENKINHKQSKKQLEDYLDRTDAAFQTAAKVQGIFLTLHQPKVHHERFASIRYKEVITVLEAALASASLPADVEVFVNHYISVLKELTGTSMDHKDAKRLAAKLYREHRNTLDFIMEHGSGTAFQVAMREVFNTYEIEGDEDNRALTKIGTEEFEFGSVDGNVCDFLPRQLADTLYGIGRHSGLDWSFGEHGYEDYWMGYPIAMWFEMDRGSSRLKLCGEVSGWLGTQTQDDLLRRVEQGISKEFQIEKLDRNGHPHHRFFRVGKGQDYSQRVFDADDPKSIETVARKMLKQLRGEFKAISDAMVGAYDLDLDDK